MQAELALRTADNWEFDAFALAAATEGRPLSMLGFHLIASTGLLAELKLAPRPLAQLLLRIEAGYQDNPYHNKARVY